MNEKPFHFQIDESGTNLIDKEMGVSYGYNERLGQPFRILLVDDDPDILNILSIYLLYEGYMVETALSGEEALTILNTYSPDVVCLDFMMPEMDGSELIANIRSRKGLLYVPIVMLTSASNQEAFKISNLEIGADAFISKPVSQKELSTTIRVMLRMKAGQDKMLVELAQIAALNGDLSERERQRVYYEALREIVFSLTQELNEPLRVAEITSQRLAQLKNGMKISSENQQEALIAEIDLLKNSVFKIRDSVRKLQLNFLQSRP